MKKKIKIVIFIIVSICILLAICLLATNDAVMNALKISKNNNTNIDTTKKSNNNLNEGIDIMMGDNYFITQLNDIYYNFKDYDGKTIEIEGFPVIIEDYKFVARYGPGCCVGDGIALMEYTYDEDIELEPYDDWIKITGTLNKGNDNGKEFIYIKVLTLDKMNERGQDTVTN